MKITKSVLNRRVFIYNMASLVAVSAIPQNVFSSSNLQNLKIGSLGISPNKIELVKNSITNANIQLGLSKNNQKSDILFAGYISIKLFQNQIKNNSIIILDGTQNKSEFDDLVNYCDENSVYLAEIVKWADKTVDGKVFERIIFHETKFNHQSVEISINYLNILSKLTANTGLIIA